MATKIPKITDFIIIGNKFIHFPKIRMFIWGMILILFLLIYGLTKFLIYKENELKSLVMNHPIMVEYFEPIETKVIKYIKSINPSLDSSTAARLAEAIVYESEKKEIPLNLILGLITIESRFDQYAISNAGALGFWQIMPKWHYDKLSSLNNKNIYDPKSNTTLGAKILSDCLKKHGGSVSMSLQCYNGNQKDVQQVYAKKVLAVANQINL